MKLSSATTSCLCARVTAAPAMGGMQMYQVKTACHGKCHSMYKTKEDFKSVLNMFKLVAAMNRAAAASRSGGPCACCASVAALSGTTMRVCDEDSLNAFLEAVLRKLRAAGAEAAEACSAHRGVVRILMDFLSVRDGRFFCDEAGPEAEDTTSPRAVETSAQENDLDHPIAHCSLNRTLSPQFGAMDSVF